MKKKCSWRGAEEKCRRTGGRVKDWLNEWVPKWCDIFSQLWDGCGTITTLLAPELFDYVAGGGGFCKKWVDDTYVMHLYNFVRIFWIVRSFSPPSTLNGCQTATLAEPKRTLGCRAIIKVQSICFRRHIRPVTQRLLNFNGKAGQDNKAGGSALRDYHFGVSNDRGVSRNTYNNICGTTTNLVVLSSSSSCSETRGCWRSWRNAGVPALSIGSQYQWQSVHGPVVPRRCRHSIVQVRNFKHLKWIFQ